MKIGAVYILLMAILLGDYNLRGVAAGPKPAFTATMTAPSGTAHADARILKFQEVVTNINGNFNAQTGKFTCTKKGTYVFFFSVCKSNSSPSLDAGLSKRKSGKVEQVASGRSTGVGVSEQVSGSVVVTLSKNEEVYVTCKGRAHGSDDHETSFSGFFLY